MLNRDLSDPRWMYLKAILFVLLGLLASGLILVESFRWQTAALLAVTVWSFARAYYFAFYVIEHYIDDDYHFAGLIDFMCYLFRRRSLDDSTFPENETTDSTD